MGRQIVRDRDGLTQAPDRVRLTAPLSPDDERDLREMLTAAGAAPVTIETRLALAEAWAKGILAAPDLDAERLDALLLKAKPETLEWYAAKVLHDVGWARGFLKNGQVDQALREAFDAGFRFALGQCKERWERPALRGIEQRSRAIANSAAVNKDAAAKAARRHKRIRKRAEERRARDPDASDSAIAGWILKDRRSPKTWKKLSLRTVRAIIARSK